MVLHDRENLIILFYYYCALSLRQVDEDKGKGSSSSCTKSVAELLDEEVHIPDSI